MRRGFLVFAVVALLASCGGSAPTIPVKSLNRLVLQRQDVGKPFQEFYDGKQGHLDNQAPRNDPTRYGREDGWVARFTRPGTTKTQGPLVVESRADLFKNAGGAKKDLLAYQELFASPALSKRRVVPTPELGDGASLGQTFVQTGTKPVRFFRIAWRYRNATAAVTVEGFDGRVHAADAVTLARKQQRRLEHG